MQRRWNYLCASKQDHVCKSRQEHSYFIERNLHDGEWKWTLGEETPFKHMCGYVQGLKVGPFLVAGFEF